MTAWWNPKYLVTNLDTGVLSQTILYANAGKIAALVLLAKHANALIEHSDALVVLLSLLILPDTAKKIIDKKFGTNAGGTDGDAGPSAGK